MEAYMSKVIKYYGKVLEIPMNLIMSLTLNTKNNTVELRKRPLGLLQTHHNHARILVQGNINCVLRFYFNKIVAVAIKFANIW